MNVKSLIFLNKKKCEILCCLLSCCPPVRAEQPIELSLTPQSFQALQVLCVVDVEGQVARCLHVAQLIAQLIETGNQVHLEIKSMPTPTTKTQMDELAHLGFPLVLFLSCTHDEISWRLYDMLAMQLIRGKKINLVGLDDQACAIHSAGQLWQELMSQSSSFDSLIAACKQVSSRRRVQKNLCLLHPFFSCADFPFITLVDKGNNFAPRWHKTRPVIFYSHHTPTNIRLMSIGSARVVHTVTDFEGQNMTPAIAADGKVVLALSNKDAVQLFLYQFDETTKKRSFVQLTHENGDCISPSFLTNDTLVFCHVNSANKPTLGILNVQTKHVHWLPVGNATCPMANADGNVIVYCKKVAGIGQVFTYELNASKERQLTHGSGDKDECSWSPCGNYIVCSVESGKNSRIAVITVATGQMRFITPAHEYWSSPCWSPRLSVPFAFTGKMGA